MNSSRRYPFQTKPRGESRGGFTLLELLVVVATLLMLAVMLLPALADPRPNNQVTQCQNNLRQLTVAWMMYAADNADKLMPNPGWVTGTMDWTADVNNTNTTRLIDPAQSLMAGYVKSPSLFKCPADQYQSSANPGPRVRSVSLNGVLGGPSGPLVQGSNPPGRKYFGRPGGTGSAVKILPELNKPGPSQVFVVLDEHPDSINDATYMFDVGYARGQERWRDLPASFHNGAGSLSFADGHTEIHQWQDTRTLTPVTINDVARPWAAINLLISADYEWLQDRMPYREE